MLICDILENKKNSDNIAIIYKGIEYSYKQLYDRCQNIMKFSNIKIKGNIAVFLPNSYDFVSSVLTASFMHKIVVPISYRASLDEIIRTTSYCDVSLVFTISKYKDIMQKLTSVLKNIIIFFIDNNEFYNLNDLDKRSYNIKSENENDTFLLIHTSGSMSKPKRVMLSHKNILTNARSIIKSLSLSEQVKTIIVLPLFLISAFTSQLITHLYLGATIVLMELPFLPNDFFKLVNEYHVTNFTCVPTVLNMLTLKEDLLKNVKSLKKICFGGAPTPKERIKELV